MRLVNKNLEISILKAICDNRDSKIALQMLSNIKDDYFYDGIAKEVYKRMKFIIREKSNIISWKEVVSDPAINEHSRELLENFSPDDKIDEITYRGLLGNLTKFHKLRFLQQLANDINNSLVKDELDVDTLYNNSISKLNTILSDKEDADCFTVIGKDSNTSEMLKRLFSGEELKYIPTGFKGWDEVNQGLPRGKLGIIASTSGGGKSLVGIQLAINMSTGTSVDSEEKYATNKVCIVPLEMSAMDMLHRMSANKTDLTMGDISAGKKIDEERRMAAFNQFKDFEQKLAEAGGSIHLYNPKEDIDMHTLLMKMQPYDFDVLIIDYIGLLKGFNGDDQWRKMSEAIRNAKIWAETTGTTVIVMAQLNDDMYLKFSKSMKDHADFMWSWNPGKVCSLVDGETIIKIEPQKGRNQEQKIFYLKSSFKKMQMRSALPEEITRYELDSATKDVNTLGKGKNKIFVRNKVNGNLGN